VTTTPEAIPERGTPTAAADQIAAYGDHVLLVEPTGAEPVPENARHGRPLGLLWTWTSPNMEFATVFIGVLAVGIFGLGFWPALAAIVLGTLLGSLTHGLLGLAGPRFGTAQMVSGRTGFGWSGNALPAGLNALTAGVGWFAVNSVSAAYALNSLLNWPVLLCLFVAVALQIAAAFLGHNFIHSVEKYAFPVLTVIFLAASVVLLTKAHVGEANGAHAVPGAFLLTCGAAFGYAAGWNPYASDYTRYLPTAVKKWQVFLWPALAVFVSCVFLEAVGAASVTIALPKGVAPFSTSAFVHPLPTWLGDVTLLAIALGGIAANALNIYSGALSFVAMGIKLPSGFGRATVAVFFGVVGTAVAWSGLHDYGTKYNDFLLVISYWIGPWLAVVFTDRILRRGQTTDLVAADIHSRRFQYWAGPVAMVLGTAVSVLLFSNQSDFTGYVARHVSGIGDIAFAVGFFLTAGLYLALRRIPALGPVRSGAAHSDPAQAA
jgi:NCS1 family nucleobase:cation symporter-1